jgi:hypothetical protein
VVVADELLRSDAVGVGSSLPASPDVIDVADSSWSWRISYFDRTAWVSADLPVVGVVEAGSFGRPRT